MSGSGVKLEVVEGAQTGSRWRLEGGTATLGRAPDCDIVLSDDKASRYHAEIRVTGDGAAVVDLGSTNATYLNARKIDRADLSDGDIIQIGSTRILASVDVAAASRPAAAASSSVEAGGRAAGAAQATVDERPAGGRRVRLLAVLLLVAVVFVALVILLGGDDGTTDPAGTTKTVDTEEREQPPGDERPSETSEDAGQSPADRGAAPPTTPPPARAKELFEEGMSFYQFGRFGRARERLQQALELAPGYAEAEQYLRRAEAAIDRRVEDALRRARSAVTALRYDEAQQAIDEVIMLIDDEGDPRRAEAERLRDRIIEQREG